MNEAGPAVKIFAKNVEVPMTHETCCWSLIDEAIRTGTDVSIPLQARLQLVADALASTGNSVEFLNRFLSASANTAAVRVAEDHINHSIARIADLASDAGMAKSSAQAYAADWIAALQGALMMRAFMGQTGPFTRTIQSLLELADQPVGIH